MPNSLAFATPAAAGSAASTNTASTAADAASAQSWQNTPHVIGIWSLLPSRYAFAALLGCALRAIGVAALLFLRLLAHGRHAFAIYQRGSLRTDTSSKDRTRLHRCRTRA